MRTKGKTNTYLAWILIFVLVLSAAPITALAGSNTQEGLEKTGGPAETVEPTVASEEPTVTPVSTEEEPGAGGGTGAGGSDGDGAGGDENGNGTGGGGDDGDDEIPATYEDGVVTVTMTNAGTLAAILEKMLEELEEEEVTAEKITSLIVSGPIDADDLDCIWKGSAEGTGLTGLKVLDLAEAELQVEGEAPVTIPEYQFAGMTVLEKASLPKNIVAIGDGAFANCANLQELDLSALAVTIDIREGAFGNVDTLEIIVRNDLWTTYIEKYSAFKGITFSVAILAPDNFKVIAGKGRTKLIWDKLMEEDGVAIVGYLVSNTAGDWGYEEKDIIKANSTMIDKMETGMYTFYLRAVIQIESDAEDGAMVLGRIATATVTINEDSALLPHLPTSLTAKPGNRAVTLTWKAPTKDADDKGNYYDNDTIKSYEVAFAKGTSNPSGWTKIDDLKELTYKFSTNLVNNTEYTFYVRAVNADGPGEAAKETATPKADESGGTSTGSTSSSGGTISQCTITFDTRGGDAVARQKVYPGNKVSVPKEPMRVGYNFTGWYTNEICTALYNFDSPVQDDMTLYAGWVLSSEASAAVKPYISGYPDSTFRPDTGITRGEAAQVLYNLAPVQSGNAAASFWDVATDSWYYDAITQLTSLGAISGYSDGSFKPEQTISRAEFATLVVRYAGLIEGAKPNFSDVSASHWAAKYIAAAQNNGLVSGDESGLFNPEANITRAEVVTMVNRMLGRNTNSGLFGAVNMPFSDVPSTHWARYEVMAAAVEHSGK